MTSRALRREASALKTLLDLRTKSMDELFAEKLACVTREFELVESRRVEQKLDVKAALDAALQAAKEAVTEQTIASEKAITKSETSTDKRIDQLGEKFDTAFLGQRRDIDGIRERLLTIESLKQGGQEQVDKQSQSMGFVVGGFGLLMTLLSIGALLVSTLVP